MKRTTLASALLGLSVVVSAGSASAFTQTFNFVEMADAFWSGSGALNPLEPNQNFEATWDQAVVVHETGALGPVDGWWDGSILGAGGSGGLLEVRADSVGGTSTTPDPAGSDHVFLEHNGVEGPGGLGVCSTGIYSEAGFDLSRCSTNFTGAGGSGTFNPGDGPVVEPEILELAFGTLVSLSLGAVTNADHDPATGVIQVAIDGGAFVDYSVTGGFFDDPSDLLGTTFWFRPTQGAGFLAAVTATGGQGQIPVPGTLLLILAGLSVTALTRAVPFRRKVT